MFRLKKGELEKRVKDYICPYCIERRVLFDKAELVTSYTNPDKRWLEYKANAFASKQVADGSNRRVVWLCTKGHHHGEMMISKNITDSGCLYCTEKRG